MEVREREVDLVKQFEGFIRGAEVIIPLEACAVAVDHVVPSPVVEPLCQLWRSRLEVLGYRPGNMRGRKAGGGLRNGDGARLGRSILEGVESSTWVSYGLSLSWWRPDLKNFLICRASARASK